MALRLWELGNKILCFFTICIIFTYTNLKTNSSSIFVIILTFFLVISVVLFYFYQKHHIPLKSYQCGDKIGEFNGVAIYYNDDATCKGRNLAKSGYNLGLKWQCVEFIKRYYYTVLSHQMPDSYGNAIDFFDKKLKDGAYNKKRDLYQYSNPSSTKPQINDIIIFDKHVFNAFGHIAIISKVTENKIIWVQQNVGLRVTDSCKISNAKDKWLIENSRILGILRK